MKQTAVEWLVEQLNEKIDFIPLDKWDMIRDIIQQAKEMEKEYYTEFEVLQLLLKLQQTKYYDNLYDWFKENKKKPFNNNEK